MNTLPENNTLFKEQQDTLPTTIKSAWHAPELHKSPLYDITNNGSGHSPDGLLGTIPSS
jgi:hypothetical protein